jgi:23S rRNA (uracil1939-C5)-methyltransferase
MTTDKRLSIGDIVEVTAERMAYGGEAVARSPEHGGMVVFVPLAAPHERLRVRITEQKKNYARAVIEEVLVASPIRREPLCRHFGDCGGCQLQHIDYRAQLDIKAGFVKEAFERIGHIDWPKEIEVRHSAEYGYRSRAQIKLERAQAARGGSEADMGPSEPARPKWLVGYHRAGSHSICNVTQCPILVPDLERELETLRSKLENLPESQIKEVDAIREVEIAVGDSAASFEPAIPGLMHGIIQQNVADATYNLRPSSFFQANRLLIEALVGCAVEGLSGSLAVDLYSGVGLFSIALAKTFRQVIAVESDAQAVRLMRKNLAENRCERVRFIGGHVRPWLKSYKSSGGPMPDVIVLDPPRTGASDSVPLIAEIRPQRIVYVSCDPATLARDLRKLIDAGYRLETVTAFDLFPQTFHVETIARLSIE